MKYKAIITVPKVVTFESVGDQNNVSNQAWALCRQFEHITISDHTFEPRLLAVIPEAKDGPEVPMVFDPPPMAA